MSRIYRYRLVVTVAACFGLVQFLIGISYAIGNYPGGYSFLGNFLSDLGRTRTWGGHDNLVCSRVFNGAIVILGISLVPFFTLVPSTVGSGNHSTWLFGLGGVVSAVGLIGIGMTPYDVYFVAHHVALAAWLAPMFFLALVYLALAFENDNASPGLILTTAALLLAVLVYGAAGSHSGYVAMQKVTAVLSVIWFAALASRIVRTGVTEISTRRQRIERLADRYLLKLQQGHRRTD